MPGFADDDGFTLLTRQVRLKPDTTDEMKSDLAADGKGR